MKLCRFSLYGVFDTKQAFPGRKRTNGRVTGDFEVEYYTSCTGSSIVDGKEYRLSEGTLLLSKPGQLRRSVLDFECYFVHFLLPEDSPYREKLLSCPDYYPIIDRGAYGSLFEDLTRHLLREGYDEESDYVNAKMLELFYRLEKDAERNRNGLALPGRGRIPDVLAAVAFIRENYARPLPLSEIAESVGYSPNYFHGVFRAVMGKTPQEYLNEVRLERAKFLLIKSPLSIAAIAYECGFSSQSYFNQTFRRLTYSTPGEYRRRGRKTYPV